MDISALEEIFQKEPKYRLKQAKEAVFKNFISDWSEATFFTKELRAELNKECPLKIAADVLVSKKQESTKARITLNDGLKIESVLMRHRDGRNTVCVSSQVGCPLGCLFCATGKIGFKRNLSVNEIIEQVVFFNRYLKKTILSEAEGSFQRITNATFMGMGEPFLNYENVLEAIRTLNSKEYFNIGARSISISTAGILEGIEKLSREGLQLNLAVSLHAPNNKIRSELMPINKKYSLIEILKSVDDYIKKTNRKVMFEYVLIKDANDSDECAKELAMLMKNKLYFLNLILYNPTLRRGSGQAGNFSAQGGPASVWKPSDTKRVESFKRILKKQRVNFVQRYRFGDDIKAACGQFSGEQRE